ncbi:hypothetical protein NYE25_05430 [Paenibacillus sp. FSL E2-8871]|uniref:hypothetical protein n=1 Tax=Paenibacillus sp. FSL E2-8871 TaxID=2975326 RepID=UPI0030F986D9
MSIRRSTFVMSGDSFFEPGVPIYVNRAYETFELNAIPMSLSKLLISVKDRRSLH